MSRSLLLDPDTSPVASSSIIKWLRWSRERLICCGWKWKQSGHKHRLGPHRCARQLPVKMRRPIWMHSRGTPFLSIWCASCLFHALKLHLIANHTDIIQMEARKRVWCYSLLKEKSGEKGDREREKEKGTIKVIHRGTETYEKKLNRVIVLSNIQYMR